MNKLIGLSKSLRNSLLNFANENLKSSFIYSMLLALIFPALSHAVPSLKDSQAFSDIVLDASFATSFNNTADPANGNILVVMTGQRGDVATTSVQYGATALTQAVVSSCGGGIDQGYAGIWYAVNVPTGSDTLTVSYDGNNDRKGVLVVSYEGVDQDTPVTASASDCDSGSTTHDVVISATQTDSVIVGLVTRDRGGNTNQFTPLTNNTELLEKATHGSGGDDAANYRSFNVVSRANSSAGNKIVGSTSIVRDSATVAIEIDNIDEPTVTLGVDNDPIDEASGVATFTATLSHSYNLDVTVDLSFSGTATGSGTDYTASDSSIVIPAGSTTGTVTVTADQDLIDEEDETVIVDIDSVVNGSEDEEQQATTTITDDDDAPLVTIGVDVDPIAEAAGVATFTATIDAVSGLDVTVDLAFSGSATGSGTDYTASGSQIVISAGDTTGSVTVTADQDVLDEINETVVVDISSVTNGTEDGSQQATTTITDDDAAPLVSLGVDNEAITEAPEDATFTATIDAVSSLSVTIDLAFSGGATGGGTDYTASSAQIVIAPGDTEGSVTVTSVQDLLDEDNETVVVDIDSVTNGTEDGSQQQTTSITDDDALPSVTLSGNEPIAEIAGVATFIATIDMVSGRDVTVDLDFSGTATGGGTDYTASAAQIVIPEGSTIGSITVSAVDDALDEDNETVVVDIDSVTNGNESGDQQATTSITDDDETPTVTLGVDNDPIAEAAGVATFTATISAVSGRQITVGLGFTGTATGSGTDYTASDSQIIIPAGDTTGSITVTADDDASDEPDETVIVDITSVTNVIEDVAQQQTTTITDDDGAPTVTLSVNTATIPETAPEAANGPSEVILGGATFTATLSNASGFEVTVDLAFSGTATATGGGVDYTIGSLLSLPAEAQIVIPAGETTGTVFVSAVHDTLDEDDETIIVDIDDVTNGTESGSQQATTTIIDDDNAGTISGTVNLSNIPGTPLEGVVVSDGTREATTDANGDYAIADVPVGEYTVTASKDGFIFKLSGETNFAFNGGSTNPVVVVSDGMPTVDILGKPALSQTVYGFWTSFLDIANVLELENTGDTELVAMVTALNQSGGIVSQFNVVVPAKGKKDAFVYPSAGFPVNSYGALKIELNHSNYDGRMNYFRNATNGTDFEFSYINPLENAVVGNSFVNFNNDQPSLLPEDSDNAVSVWLSIVNHDMSSTKRFVVNQYDQSGVMTGTKTVKVPAMGRVDVPGSNGVGNGLNEIVPNDQASPYNAVAVRYGQTGPDTQSPVEFNFAAAFASKKGDPRSVSAPFTIDEDIVSWLEAINGSSSSLGITVNVYDKAGNLSATFAKTIPAKSQRHYNINSLFPANTSTKGYVEIIPDTADALTAQSMVYFFHPTTQKLKAVTNYNAREPFGTSQFAPYNLYLNSIDRAELFNLTDSITTVIVKVYSDPNAPLTKTYNIPARGRINVKLLDPVGFGTNPDTYGLVEIITDDPGTVGGAVSRSRSTTGLDFVTQAPLR